MPRLTVDLTQAQKREPVPDDTYECIISEVSDVQKGTKSNYVMVTYEIVEGEFASRKLFDNVMVSGKAAGQFAELWKKVTGEELVYGEGGIDVDTDELLGREVSVVTVQEEYPEGSGEFNSKVKRVLGK